MHPKPDSALIVAGHGSTVNADSNGPTLDHVERIARLGLFGEVYPAFWKEEPSFRQVLHMVDRSDIYIVPNFISEGYFTRTIIPREFGLAGPITERNGQTLKYCEPAGSHPQMTELLLARAAQAAPTAPPEQTSLIIVGHGTDLNDNSAAAAKREVAKIRALGRYAEVLNAYMEEAPFIARWDEIASQPHVVVVPFFISDGLHSYQDIPVLLGLEAEVGPAASQREIFRRNPYELRGRILSYASAIGTEPRFAELIVEQVEAFDLQHALATT